MEQGKKRTGTLRLGLGTLTYHLKYQFHSGSETLRPDIAGYFIIPG